MTPLKTQAIQIALTGNWDEAILLNQQILETEPTDIDTLNRLAFAYTIIGKTQEARETYERVLTIDAANPIALKNIKKLGISGIKTKPALHISTKMFLEESGKTKIVSLVNTAPTQIIKTLQMGQLLHLCIKRSKVFVQDEQKEYVGMLPDDIGKRLITFLEGGNEYESYVKSAHDHEVVIFIKEAKRAAKYKNQPSFLFGDKTRLSLSVGKKNQDLDDDGE